MPALSHVTKVFGSRIARIAALTADPAGGPATYGTSVAVPGIKQVAYVGTVDTKELRGDHQLLDADAVLRKIDLTVDWAKFSFDTMAALLAWSITDSGAAPNRVTSADLIAPVLLPYFKIEVASVSADAVGGDVHFVAYKCKIASLPEMGTAEEDFRHQKMTCSAIPRIADQKWINVTENETLAVPV